MDVSARAFHGLVRLALLWLAHLDATAQSGRWMVFKEVLLMASSLRFTLIRWQSLGFSLAAGTCSMLGLVV